ncbi:MAG TPA: hypothetical protein VEX69_05085, partial [Candidatus Limnocylindria bacterium]|nr:hypothetical protein [Candidatus Limnocylindria bacterium]
MTRNDLIAELDLLKTRARPVLLTGWIVFMSIGIAAFVYVMIHARDVHSGSFLRGAILCLAVWLAGVVIFCVALRRTVARYAPSCPLCNKRITWRERESTLDSGKCP